MCVYVGTVHSQCIAEVNEGRAGQAQGARVVVGVVGAQCRETASAGQAQAQAEHTNARLQFSPSLFHSGSSLCATLSEVESECW